MQEGGAGMNINNIDKWNRCILVFVMYVFGVYAWKTMTVPLYNAKFLLL